MDISTLLGLILGFGSLIVSVLMEGGSPLSFLALSAMLIVFGGTFGATLISYPMDVVMTLPKLFSIALKKQDFDEHKLIKDFVGMAEKARKNGLLSLEDEAKLIKDTFTQQAVMLAIDGTEAETLKEILESQIDSMAERHEVTFGMLESMGGFAPTMGIIGTVMGLVHVLSNLSNPNSLGPKIAVAFIATLWGVMSANLLWIPIGAKLKRKSHHEVFFKTLVIAGIMGLQSGDNPRIIQQKLEGMVPADTKKKSGKNAEGGAKEQKAA